MNKKEFINLLDDCKDDLHSYLQKCKTKGVGIDGMGKASIGVWNLSTALRDCPEVFAELDEDQILTVVATLYYADFIAEMSDSYQTTRSEQHENNLIRRKIVELIGEPLPKHPYCR